MLFLRNFFRRLFLTLLGGLLLANVLFLETGFWIDQTVLDPGFLLRTLEQTGFYGRLRDITVAALTEAGETGAPKEVEVLREVLQEAITPEIIQAQVERLIPAFLALLKNPATPDVPVLELTGFKGNLLRSLQKRLGGTISQRVWAEIQKTIPDQLALLSPPDSTRGREGRGLDPAFFVELNKYYQLFSRGLVWGVVLLLGLMLTGFLLAGRKAWGLWLGVPVGLAGLAVVAFSLVTTSYFPELLGSSRFAPAQQLGTGGVALLEGLRAVAGVFLNRFLLVGIITCLFGLTIWLLWHWLNRVPPVKAAATN